MMGIIGTVGLELGNEASEDEADDVVEQVDESEFCRDL